MFFGEAPQTSGPIRMRLHYKNKPTFPNYWITNCFSQKSPPPLPPIYQNGASLSCKRMILQSSWFYSLYSMTTHHLFLLIFQ